MTLQHRLADALLAAVLGCLVWLAFTGGVGRTPQPQPVPIWVPQPAPAPLVPHDGRWMPHVDGLAETTIGGRIAPDKVTEIECDLPEDLQMKNVGGSDGAGLCVFTSINHSALFQNVEALKDFQAWMRKRPGGGYPEKVTQMIQQICKEKGLPVPDYLQVESNDLDILKLACKTGRLPGVTYSFSPSGRYNGQKIAHMTTLCHLDDHYGCICDNNYIGVKNFEWLTPQEFLKSYSGGQQGWAVILLPPPPPPSPRN